MKMSETTVHSQPFKRENSTKNEEEDDEEESFPRSVIKQKCCATNMVLSFLDDE